MIWIFAGIILSGNPIDGSGVVLITLIVPVLYFSAAPIDEEVARTKATIADNFNFIKFVHKLY